MSSLKTSYVNSKGIHGNKCIYLVDSYDRDRVVVTTKLNLGLGISIDCHNDQI